MDVEKWSQIDDVVLTDHEEFDFIPANTTFKGNKTPLDTASASEKRLGKALEQLSKDYHYIVCDCPPDLRVHEECDHCEWECRSPNETRIGDDLLGARSMASSASPRYDARLRG